MFLKNTFTFFVSLTLASTLVLVTGCKKEEKEVSVGTVFPTEITATTALAGGTITDGEGAGIVERGVCWSTSPGVTTDDNSQQFASGTDDFTVLITGLSATTTYYIRAYVTTGDETVYGNEIEFSTTYAIGTPLQGGEVAYVFQSGDPGYVSGEQHGLIVTTSDQSTGAPFGCNGTSIVTASGTGIGTGQANTTAIVNDCTTAGIAAKICDDLNLNGYDDWYLPSIDELRKLDENVSMLTNLGIGDTYVTSSQNGAIECWTLYVHSNSALANEFSSKATNYHVRAIRTF